MSLSAAGSRSFPEVQQGQVCSPPATADLPLHSALFSQQLLDLTHRWWSEAESPDIDVNDVYPLAAAAYICIKLHPARYPDPAPFQLPDPRQLARSLTDLLTTLAAILGRRQPHNVPPLHSAQIVHEVVAEEYPILESVNYELVTYTPGDWVKLFEVRFSLRAQQLHVSTFGPTPLTSGGVPSAFHREPKSEVQRHNVNELYVGRSSTKRFPTSNQVVCHGSVQLPAWPSCTLCPRQATQARCSLVRGHSKDNSRGLDETEIECDDKECSNVTRLCGFSVPLSMTHCFSTLRVWRFTGIACRGCRLSNSFSRFPIQQLQQ